jgi:hypothetical protein
LGSLSIKIGIELSHGKLRCDLLTHPERYFFILVADGQGVLCIRTCNPKGENIEAHIIDGLIPNEEGYLVSVFEEGIRDAIWERDLRMSSCEGDEYPISSRLSWMICQMPDLADWIISSVLTNGKNLVIFSHWEAEIPRRNWESQKDVH